MFTRMHKRGSGPTLDMRSRLPSSVHHYEKKLKGRNTGVPTFGLLGLDEARGYGKQYHVMGGSYKFTHRREKTGLGRHYKLTHRHALPPTLLRPCLGQIGSRTVHLIHSLPSCALHPWTAVCATFGTPSRPLPLRSLRTKGQEHYVSFALVLNSAQVYWTADDEEDCW